MQIYIHIPFCLAKCSYCDFPSYAPTHPIMRSAIRGTTDTLAVWEAYKNALCRELHHAAEKTLRDTSVETVFVGGGTPTAWPAPFLYAVLQAVKRFRLASDAEITVEANPGTLTPEKLLMLRENGVNRLSIGLQAWQDILLKRIGRIHTQADFISLYENARAIGFCNINVDLMFALPGQTEAQWRETVNAVAALCPEHISAYSLTPEEGTPLWEQLQHGGLEQPDDTTDRAMYYTGRQLLYENGYEQYELSNFARRGYACRHNMGYWMRVPYRGFGLGAHSFSGEKRWHNPYDLATYIQSDDPDRRTPETEAFISRTEAMAETLFLGLRMTSGVSLIDFARCHGVEMFAVYGDWIRKMQAAGLLCLQDGFLRLTERGMDLANQVCVGFI